MARYEVDFQHVRANADIVAVLAHHKVSLQGDGEQRKGQCHCRDSGSPALSVNVSRIVFKCHSCGAGGNIIALMQHLDENLKNPRQAALRVAELSGIPAKPNGKVESTAVAVRKVTAGVPAALVAAVAAQVAVEHDGKAVNRPLTFELKLAPVDVGADNVASQFASERGLNCERLAELGIGVGQRGSMKDLLAIPIHNVEGELVAYCGRDLGLRGADAPKYVFPKQYNRELELYGWDTAQYYDQVALVEGFMPVIKHGGVAAEYGESGIGVASLMGFHISDAQIELLLQTQPRVVVCFLGEPSRQLQAMAVASSLANAGLWVTIRSCLRWQDPFSITSDEFCQVVGKI